MSGTTNFERCCRLCAKDHEVTIMLYSMEAADMLLSEKLQKYLLIKVEKNDVLPKNICIKCCTTLESLCEFIEMVRITQENLYTLITSKQQLDVPTMMNDLQEEQTELEICIDPMDVINTPDDNSTEQFTYPYTDDVVTLKLIPKNNNEQSITCENKKHVCEVCHKSFLDEQLLKNHSWIHIRDEDYCCYTCQTSFGLQSELEKHIRIVHKPESRTGFKYICNHCGRRFKKKFNYDGHLQIHKPMTKAYTCAICGRSYENWAGLKIHNITHSTEKPFKCNICDKKFKRNQELKFHMNHHTGAKPYKCKYCDRCFASTGNLYSHSNRAHFLKNKSVLDPAASKETNKKSKLARPPNIILKKYTCQYCKKSFGRQENYLYHMFQHTGEKPFKCAHCDLRFITQRSLSSHYDNVHPSISKPAMPMPVFDPKNLNYQPISRLTPL